MAPDEPTQPTAPEPTQPWLAPATLDYTGAEYLPSGRQGGPPPPPTFFELRPLTLSEVLDRTFALYRSRFWLFSGIAVFSGALQALVGIGSLLTQGRMMRQIGAAAGKAPGTVPAFIPGVPELIGIAVTFVGALLFFLAYSVTTAASVWAVSEVYLGRPADVRNSFRATIRRWYRYIGIAVWQAFSWAWIPAVSLVLASILSAVGGAVLGGVLIVVGILGGGIGGYILYLRNMLAVPACVTERLTVRQSMRRSKGLAAGGKARIFVMQLVLLALYFVVGMLQMPFSMLAMFSVLKQHGIASYILQSITVIIGFLGHTVVTPILAIGITLLYFDARVRKEAFDIAVLMGEEHLGETDAAAMPASIYPPAPAPPVYPVTPASFSGVAEPMIAAPQPDEAG